jgi:hypothetical protein
MSKDVLNKESIINKNSQISSARTNSSQVFDNTPGSRVSFKPGSSSNNFLQFVQLLNSSLNKMIFKVNTD